MTEQVFVFTNMQIFKDEKLFNRRFIRLINLGENQGNLADSFAKINDITKYDLEKFVSMLFRFLEPALIMLIGLIMFLLVMIVMMATLSLLTEAQF